jgi:hypothetical protein
MTTTIAIDGRPYHGWRIAHVMLPTSATTNTRHPDPPVDFCVAISLPIEAGRMLPLIGVRQAGSTLVCTGRRIVPMTSRPVLALTPEHCAEVRKYYEQVAVAMGRYLELADAGEGADLEAARSVAAELDGVVHSSDTDCDYYPCVLHAPDPTSDAFFAALDIPRGAPTKVGGFDEIKLDVAQAGDGEGQRSAVALLTRLGEYEMGMLHEYVSDTDLAALEAAEGALAAIGPVVGVQLCTDEVSKLVLTLAERSPGVYVGVATIRIET